MAVSCLTRVVKGLLRKEEAMSVSELIQFVIMLCGVAMLFYVIGKDVKDNSSNKDDTKK
jgi:hypothetical protein